MINFNSASPPVCQRKTCCHSASLNIIDGHEPSTGWGRWFSTPRGIMLSLPPHQRFRLHAVFIILGCCDYLRLTIAQGKCEKCVIMDLISWSRTDRPKKRAGKIRRGWFCRCDKIKTNSFILGWSPRGGIPLMAFGGYLLHSLLPFGIKTPRAEWLSLIHRRRKSRKMI